MLSGSKEIVLTSDLPKLTWLLNSVVKGRRPLGRRQFKSLEVEKFKEAASHRGLFCS
jgi:hypothetical protein